MVSFQFAPRADDTLHAGADQSSYIPLLYHSLFLSFFPLYFPIPPWSNAKGEKRENADMIPYLILRPKLSFSLEVSCSLGSQSQLDKWTTLLPRLVVFHFRKNSNLVIGWIFFPGIVYCYLLLLLQAIRPSESRITFVRLCVGFK